MTGWQPFIIVLPLLTLIQWLIARRLGSVVLVGDEGGYVSCGGRQDPYAPEQFLRVPLMAWFSRQAHRFSDNPETLLRSTSNTASLLGILISMLSAQILGGPLAALVIGLLLTLMPGRIILSHHIWPDIWLGLWLSLVCLVLVHPDLPPDLRALLLGGIATLAFLTRFDALLLAPSCAFALAPTSMLHWALILLPTVTAFACLCVRNARRYQIPWPDNTWMFNVMITAGETASSQGRPVLVEQEILKTSQDWKALSSRQQRAASLASIRRILSRPLPALRGLLGRFWASLGPDHFVLHRLLPPLGHAYPEISAGLNRFLVTTLTFAFPLFAAGTLLALLIGKPSLPVFLWPILAMAAGSLIHNRTRYRQAWLPGAVLIVATVVGQAEFWRQLSSWEAIPAWLLSIALAGALIRFRVRPDIMES